MHVQTSGMRILSFADSLYQDDGTVLNNVIILPNCWTEYLHSINQSVNQSINQSINQAINQEIKHSVSTITVDQPTGIPVSYILQFLDEKGLRY